MKSYQTYAELELISLDQEQSRLYPPQSPTFWQRLAHWMATGSQKFLQFCAGSSEPKILQRCDRQGNLYFQVYDPTTGLSATLGSGQEVRSWLERRYSQ